MHVKKTGLFSPQYRGETQEHAVIAPQYKDETQEHAVIEEAVTTPAQLGEGRKDLGFRVT